MSTVDATAGESGLPAPAAPEAAPAPAVIGPLAGDPSIWGLASFIAGSVALGLSLVGVVPFGVLGAPLAIIVAATSLGLLLSAIWCAALGQSAVAAVFGIFGTSWLSIIVMLTLATLRLPSAFSAVFALIDLALLLLYIGFAQASAAGVTSSGLLKAAGYVVLAFAAIGVYLFFSAAAVGTGGKPLPLGKPLQH